MSYAHLREPKPENWLRYKIENEPLTSFANISAKLALDEWIRLAIARGVSRVQNLILLMFEPTFMNLGGHKSGDVKPSRTQGYVHEIKKKIMLVLNIPFARMNCKIWNRHSPGFDLFIWQNEIGFFGRPSYLSPSRALSLWLLGPYLITRQYRVESRAVLFLCMAEQNWGGNQFLVTE